MSNKINRKKFFKRVGMSLAGVMATTVSVSADATRNPLRPQQKEFLADYEEWLREFHKYIKRKNINTSDINNNKELMRLTEVAENRKEELALHMKDPLFERHFNNITKNITYEIT
ncbi:hypothetical protein [Saccharicrinis aurantiacus]|uniref:hypothetical protein n=1 Tax=Saccharicrinis aurantiacus TaxID=1849719 RepID=UPI000837DE61|nr:hypothetical protein [Saccharicrinis aurantiacus]